jgi:hypothetical protein
LDFYLKCPSLETFSQKSFLENRRAYMKKMKMFIASNASGVGSCMEFPIEPNEGAN